MAQRKMKQGNKAKARKKDIQRLAIQGGISRRAYDPASGTLSPDARAIAGNVSDGSVSKRDRVERGDAPL